MTCKDCIYYEACKSISCRLKGEAFSEIFDDNHLGKRIAENCKLYNNKSEWIHLPCKVGDRVFSIVIIGGEYRIVVDRVLALKITTDNVYVETEYIDAGEIGYTVFLILKEAEKALAERKKK